MAIWGLSAVDESAIFMLHREEEELWGVSPGCTGDRLPGRNWALFCSAAAAVLARHTSPGEGWVLRRTDLKVGAHRERYWYQNFCKACYKLKRTSSASILFLIMAPLRPQRGSCYFYILSTNYIAYLIILLYLSEVPHSPSERAWPKCESYSDRAFACV